MDITSLDRLQEVSDVSLLPNGLSVTANPSWVVAGENRLSYTTLIRLIECCREHHWKSDIIPFVEKTLSVDSVVKSLTADFARPIKAGTRILIIYRVMEVYEKAYLIQFEVCDPTELVMCARFQLVSVFFDPMTYSAVIPPVSVLDHLRATMSISANIQGCYRSASSRQE